MSSKGMNKGVIQIGSGKPITIKEIGELLVKFNDKDLLIVYNKNKPEGDFGRLAIIDKAKNVLNWEPKISFEIGLKKCV